MLVQPSSRQGSREFREESKERVKDRDLEYLRYLLHAHWTGLPVLFFFLFAGSLGLMVVFRMPWLEIAEDHIRKPQAIEIPAGEHHPKVSERFPKAGTLFETQQGCQACD